jgi:hypothetical protein
VLHLRLQEHARVYKTLLEDFMIPDIARNWSVLLLGRDMDYAFIYINQVAPELITEKRVVTIPLSRTAAKSMTNSSLARLLLATAPRLQMTGSAGLKIYDVGFHGQIPAAISVALSTASWFAGQSVRARLLNGCRCHKPNSEGCFGRPIMFADGQGKYRVSREFGVSIERLPHRTGVVERVIETPNGFTYEYAEHTKEERALAMSLEHEVKHHVLKGIRRLSNKQNMFSRIAKLSAETLTLAWPSWRRALRTKLQPLYDFGQESLSRTDITRIVYPLCGTDIVTPLLCCPNVEQVTLVDYVPAHIKKDSQLLSAAARYLARSISLSHKQRDVRNVEARYARRPRRLAPFHLSELHGLALAASGPLMSGSGLLAPLECTVIERCPNSPEMSPRLGWILDFDDGRRIAVEYTACVPSGNGTGIKEIVQDVAERENTAVLLMDLDGTFARGKPRLWSAFTAMPHLVIRGETANRILRVDGSWRLKAEYRH